MEDVLEILIPIVFIAFFLIRAIKGAIEKAAQSQHDEQEDSTVESWEDAWSVQQPRTRQAVAQSGTGSPPPIHAAGVAKHAPAMNAAAAYAARKRPPPVHPAESGMEDIGEEDGQQSNATLAPSLDLKLAAVHYESGNRQRGTTLRIRGRDDLRRAVILREVLERPRAFDL